MVQGYPAIALRLGIDMKIFDAVAQHIESSGEKTITLSQLAEMTKADPLLVCKSLSPAFLSEAESLEQAVKDPRNRNC